MRRGHGNVVLEARGDGRWAWILDAGGNVLVEIDCGLDLADTPADLREDVRGAYEYAVADNRATDEERRREFGDADERKEWGDHYNTTRGVS